jgi:putative endonuclease
MASSVHYFYVLHTADNTYYGGYTTDPVRRLAEHNAGTGAKYTRLARRRPLTMIHLEKFDTRSEALQAEASFKKLSSRAKKDEYLATHKSNLNEINFDAN